MTIYEATLTEVGGRRAAELNFRLNRADHRPRRVLLIEEICLTPDQPLPFVWSFSHESQEPWVPGAPRKQPHPPVLKVIAAPGASVQFHGFPESYVPQPGTPAVNLYRVQDPAVLPRLASDTPSMNLLGTYEVADQAFVTRLPGATPQDPPRSYSMVRDAGRGFVVRQESNGVVIEHMGSGDVWSVTVPMLSRDPQAALDARARYAFEIDIDAGAAGRKPPTLRLVTTPGVKVTLMERAVRLSFAGRYLGSPVSPQAYSWDRWEVDDIHQVPPQGAPFEVGEGWRRHPGVTRLPNPQEQALMRESIVADAAIGFVPVAGDAVDVAELLYGVATDHDKWGRRLEPKDLALLGVGAVLPFVGGDALKGLRRLVRRFAEHADDAADLARRVGAAHLSGEDYAVIQKLEAMVKAGQQPSPAEWKQALAVLKRIPGAEPTIETLLNAKGSGFAHVQLQAAYERYTVKQGRKKRPTKDPVEWARSVTDGLPRELFTTLLGPNYAKRAPGAQAPPLNLLDIPRPDGYADELLQTHLDTAGKNPRLWERLGKLLAEPQDPGAASLGLLRRQVAAGRFRILKGNLAEIFSMPFQHAELARLAKTHLTAVLVSGVRIRLMHNGKLSASKLFSDNIIVVKQGNRVQILAVFEVKSGFRGGEEAAEQIFEWSEGRLTDGSQLLLPKGTTFTAANGRTWTSKNPITYTWKPKDPDLPTITGLASTGERHLVTARGASVLGIDSGLHTASKVTHHQLEQTSAQLDYLAADILLGRKPPAKPPTLPAAQ